MENIKEKLHHNLGKLFYAVAMADKKIEVEEITVFKTEIRNRWSDPDVKQNELAVKDHHEIINIFTQLQAISANSDSCFNEFSEFYNEHKNLFSKDTKKRIWNTAQAIALSFAHKNKSELILLAKLKMLLEK
ncbi:MAG: hypothetical protein HKP42_06520 [Maribacter sp.]|nr:hypothetical protein [Maribacter sp.]NNK17617.1 hypothetical protein [Maribacter sp.]NNK75701.1 hypothetical protein [Maribacter sp.]